MGLTKIIASILVLMAFVVAAQAQVTVTLVDGEGKPVAEATVEANKKVIGKTDADGTATLDASYLNQQLCFTHVSFQLFCEKVTNNVNKFTLKSNDNILDAAVVTSYENTTRRNTVGNVSSIDMSKVPVLNTSNALSALQGLATGLDIVTPSGSLGQASKVRVQGDQSLFFSAPPIYVIDGMIISEYQTNSIAKNNISGLNVISSVSDQNSRGNYIDFLDFNNIESITILKDADAVAIYGSRGANGAIVITTKKAIANNIRLYSNFNLSWQPRRIELMNTEEYLLMRKRAIENSGINNINGQAFYDLTLYDSLESNNWQDIIMGHSIFNYSIGFSISSYNQGTSNRFAVDFRPNKHFYDTRGSFNQFSVSNSLDKEYWNGKVRLSNFTNMGFLYSEQNAIDLTSFSTRTPPNFPKEIFDSPIPVWYYNDQKLYSFYFENPLNPKNNIYKYKSYNLMNSFGLRADINRFVKYDLNYGLSFSKNEDIFIDKYDQIAFELFPTQNGSFQLKSYEAWGHNFATFATINSSDLLGKLSLTNIIGVNYNSSNNQAYLFTSVGNPLDEYSESINFYNSTSSRQDKVFYRYFAFYNRFLARYNNFMLNLNYSYDGSSRFSPESRWASFYSIGIGWNLSDEEWFKDYNFFFKPRITYGRIGNDNIPDYGYIQKFDYVNSLNYPNGMLVKELNLYSRNYKWEDYRKLNLGFDFKLKSLSILFDYSIATSTDQLIDYRLPEYLGQSSIFRNFPGVFRTKSFEFNISYDFKLSPSKNIFVQALLTIPKDKLISFPDLDKSSYSNMLIIGKTKYLSRLPDFKGVDLNNGLYYYSDNEGNSTNSLNQALFNLVETPVKYYGSFLFTFNSKKIKISSNIGFRQQKNLTKGSYKYSASPSSLPGIQENNYRFLLYENFDVRKESDYQKFLVSSSIPPYGRQDDLNMYFFRINNLSLSYNLYVKKGKSIDVSCYVNNVLLKTNVNTLNYEAINNFTLPSLLNTGINLNLNF